LKKFISLSPLPLRERVRVRGNKKIKKSQTMPNKNYINGRSLEYRIKNILKENGFYVVRSAGSHGKWDLIAVNESKKTIYLISCKKGKRKRHIKKGSYSVSEFIIGSTKDLTSHK
jgi:hypothetical protein